MKKDTVVELRRPAQGQDLLSTMLRDDAQRLVAQAVQAEFEDFLARFSGERFEDGRAAVVRNGFQPEREVLTGLGSVRARIPKARSRLEEPAVFHSSLVPPYVRRAKSVEAVLPWLYLHGRVSTGNMQEALAALLDPEAAELSASVVARLKNRWMEEYRLWRRSKLGRDRWVYLWVDGIGRRGYRRCSTSRLKDAASCCRAISSPGAAIIPTTMQSKRAIRPRCFRAGAVASSGR